MYTLYYYVTTATTFEEKHKAAHTMLLTFLMNICKTFIDDTLFVFLQYLFLATTTWVMFFYVMICLGNSKLLF